MALRCWFSKTESIPESVCGYLDYTVRPRPATPKDQLFDHGSIVCGTNIISARLQGEIDGRLQPLGTRVKVKYRGGSKKVNSG